MSPAVVWSTTLPLFSRQAKKFKISRLIDTWYMLCYLLTTGKEYGARAGLSEANLKDLVRTSAKYVLNNGGAVRGFSSWGTLALPTRTRRHQEYHTEGYYWLMHFDTNPIIVQALQKKFKTDPRVIRGNIIKLGEKLEDIVERPDKTR
ncbi:11642_t:CDS:2 [Paraglomus brasilianum]|uniref:11642_t:CDS:1 n=1 Tax=Paraglomus brasilianum TaxID=144538 RepID=A0A9N9F0I2_9GLOM|nr:11642_t:CDS:2 [Paraglomus brasilianum]